VVGFREGTMLEIRNRQIELIGPLSARIFRKGDALREVSPGVTSGSLWNSLVISSLRLLIEPRLIKQLTANGIIELKTYIHSYKFEV
jgi:hypothetical protein